MDYLQYFCKECKHHGYNVTGKGICYHPDVLMLIGGWCRACHRLALRDKKKQG